MREGICIIYFLRISRKSGVFRSRIARKASERRSRKCEVSNFVVNELVVGEFDNLCPTPLKAARNFLCGIGIDFVVAGNIADIPNSPLLDILEHLFNTSSCNKSLFNDCKVDTDKGTFSWRKIAVVVSRNNLVNCVIPL